MSSRVPSDQAPPRIFFGWYIIGLTSLSAVFAGTTSQAFFGVFLRPIEDETGWSRTSIAGAVTIATFVGGGIAVFIGRLADHYGPRVLMMIGVFAYATGYTGMLLVSQIWQLYVAFFITRMAALQFLAGVVPRTMAVNWFRRKRGRALGLQATAMPLGGAALAAIAGSLIGAGVPWRIVLAIFGFTALVLLPIPTAFIARREPEEMGLLPDGDDALKTENNITVQERFRGTEVSWTLRETLRTRAMWLVAAGSFLQTMASGGIAFLIPSYFEDTGLSTQIAAAGASAFLLGGAASSTLWGFLTERYDERVLVVSATATAMILSIGGRFVSEPIGALVFAALYGATTRGEGALVMMMLAAYYGRRSYGTISGFSNTFTMMGLGMGPLIYSRVLDSNGGFYPAVFYVSTALLAVATILMWAAQRPIRKS